MKKQAVRRRLVVYLTAAQRDVMMKVLADGAWPSTTNRVARAQLRSAIDVLRSAQPAIRKE